MKIIRKYSDFKLVLEEEIENPCRRGVNVHYWYVYMCNVSGEIIKNEDETNDIDWILLEEVKNLTLEPVWQYIFDKIKII